jgi:hypothetical protein
MRTRSAGKRTIAAILVAIAIAPAAFAIFGIGDIVFDPSSFQKLVDQLVQMEQQYSQLVETYRMVTAQYDQMIWMAKMIPANLRAHYRALVTPWRNTVATDTYGTTGGWISAINSGTGVPTGYRQAIEPLNAYGSALSHVPVDQLDRVKINYATVELADGANQSGIDLVGRLRGNAPQVEAAIQVLENDSLSADPDLNTEISVLNKVNAANLIALRNGQDTNKLLVALTEEQLIDAKRKRDAEAAAINAHIQFMAQEQDLLRAQTGDPSDRMLAYRMP